MNLPDDKNRRVLVVDDNHAIHDDFRKILSPATALAAATDATEAAVFGASANTVLQARFEMDSAHQGQEGVLLVQKALEDGRPYALAFVDVRMPPGEDGVETTRKMWALDPDLQVVFCTAHSDYSWSEMFAKLNQRAGWLILKKPFDGVEALQLAHSLTEKWWLHQQSQRKMEELEGMVAERTAKLRLLNSAVEQAKESILIVEPETDLSVPKILFVNPAFTRLTGYAAEEAIGKTTEILHGPRTDQTVISQISQKLKQGETFEGEVINYRKDGTEFCMELHFAPICNASGKVTQFVAIQHDITERKRAAEALQHSETKFRTLYDSTSDAVMLLDENGFFDCNPAALSIFGCASRAEFCSKHPADLSPPVQPDGTDSRTLACQRIATAAAQGSLNFEWLHQREDTGETFPADVLLTAMKLDGKPVLQAVVRDITKRKQIKAELTYERDLLRTLLDQSPDEIYFKDAQSRFIKSSKAHARQFGVADPEAMVGKTDFDFFTEEHARPAFEDEQEIIRTGVPLVGKVEKEVWLDGQETWVFTSKMPFRNNDGQIVGTFGVSKDITAMKLAEERLRQLSQAVEQSPACVVVTDPAGNITYVNPKFTAITGYTFAEVLGKNSRILKSGETSAAAYTELWQTITAGQEWHGEFHNKKKNGELYWESASISPIFDAAGKITSFLAVKEDITAHKSMEEKLFQAQKLETVGKLAGGIAHEFNSILTAIIGQSELLIADLPAGDPLAKNATEIRSAADRAASLTRQLLAYGRKQFLQPEALDLNRVLASMDGMLRQLMGGETVAVNLLPAAGLHLVKADAGQIEQVITNLAFNARDAMPNGGRLTLETANVTFDAESVGRDHPELKPGNYALLAITDTGTGMSPEIKARVFEPFFTTKGVGQGTGLGLSTCYGIIKQSGGHISVYSEPGRGTTFKIYLPQIPAENQPPPPKSAALPGGTETILLVEDDASLCELAATLLRRLGYTVLTAANGVEALSLKQQRATGHIDLLFTDVVMPHMSGKELADRVQALFPHTKILFTSAYTENASLRQGVLDKGVAFLQKPFTPTALAHKVRAVLDQPSP
jgi:PAS domain S-box-containing protein